MFCKVLFISKISLVFALFSICVLVCNEILFHNLESILCQKTNHNFKVLIIDDCSTDDTHSIAIKYVKKHNNVYYFRTKKNSGLGKNCLITLEKEIKDFVNSDYLFRIDYDDFIIDPQKFEKQINILELNKNLIASCHHYRIQKENGEIYDDCKSVVGVYTCKDILKFYVLNEACTYNHTATYMFRNIFKSSLPPRFRETSWAFGDMLFNFDFFRFGEVHYSNEIMTTYYIHNHGRWSLLSANKKNKYNLTLFFKIFYFLNFQNKIYFIYLLFRKVLKKISI